MAGNSVIGALRVNLGLDSAQFTQGLKTAQSGLAKFGAVAGISAAAIVGTMTAVGGAVGVAVRGMINDMDEMSKASQKFGVPIDELSKLRYAADLSDVSFESLGKALTRLSVNMNTFATTGKGPAAAALKGLGISATDAQSRLKSSSEVIGEVADRFVKMQDGAQKTALAVAIFGKAGAELIPMLNGGSAGLKEMGDEAAQLGLVMDTETAKAAEEFNDNLTRLHAVGQGLTTQLAAGLTPALASVSAAIVGAVKNSKAFEVAGTALGYVLRALITVVGGFIAANLALGLSLMHVGKAAWKFAHGDFGGAADEMGNIVGDVKKTFADFSKFSTTIWSKAAPTPAMAKQQGAAIAAPASEAAKAAKKAEDELKKRQEGISDAIEKIHDKLANEGSRVFDETRSPLEKYNAELERLGRLLRLGAIGQDTFNRAVSQAKSTLDNASELYPDAPSVDDVLKAGGDEDAARKKLADENKKAWFESTSDGLKEGMYAIADGNFFDYLKAKLQDKLFSGLADALSGLLQSKQGGGGLGGFFASAANDIFGFARGGTIMPGGSGGIDSQLVQFRKSPNERVDITKPGQSLSSGKPITVSHAPQITIIGGDNVQAQVNAALMQAESRFMSRVPGYLAQHDRMQG